MDRKANQILGEHTEGKQKIEDLTASLSIEKRRREDFEELVKKERRDKQIALSCLHEAEAKLESLRNQIYQRDQEMERLKVNEDFADRGLEIKL